MTPPTFYPRIYFHGVGDPSRAMIPPVGGVFSDFVPLVGSYVGGLVPFCASLSTISIIGISEPGWALLSTVNGNRRICAIFIGSWGVAISLVVLQRKLKNPNKERLAWTWFSKIFSRENLKELESQNSLWGKLAVYLVMYKDTYQDKLTWTYLPHKSLGGGLAMDLVMHKDPYEEELLWTFLLYKFLKLLHELDCCTNIFEEEVSKRKVALLGAPSVGTPSGCPSDSAMNTQQHIKPICTLRSYGSCVLLVWHTRVVCDIYFWTIHIFQGYLSFSDKNLSGSFPFPQNALPPFPPLYQLMALPTYCRSPSFVW